MTGTQPRRHHYVPQFYLRRFADANARVWVWDKTRDRVIQSTTTSIAAETDFYRLRKFEQLGHDPYILERQLADMEGQAATITDQWLFRLRSIEPGSKIRIPKVHRYIVARFMAVQFLRTADTREILALLAPKHKRVEQSKVVDGDFHAALMWDQPIIRMITNHIREAIWIFARNETNTPFITSDNPIAFRTKDSRMWLKVGFMSNGTYVVYPLAPDVVMFAHERKFWRRIQQFDRSLSLVSMTPEMVESENSGQVFMASRFLVSPTMIFGTHGNSPQRSEPTSTLYRGHRGKSPNDVLFEAG